MIFSKLFSLFFAFSILSLSLSAFSSEAERWKSGLQVAVTGLAPTYEEARNQAIRNALQLALKQLVVVDRKIVDDKIVRDRILSTINGYIEAYHELEVRQDSGMILVKAEITVSPTRIEHFVGSAVGSDGEISGGEIKEELRRAEIEMQHRENQVLARREIFSRIFGDFPTSAMKVSLEKLEISPRNSDSLRLSLKQEVIPSFIAMMRGTLEALSIKSCEFRRPAGYNSWLLSGWLNKKSVCPYDQKIDDIVKPYISAKYRRNYLFRHACIGIYDEKRVYCYLLSDGATFLKDSITMKRPVVAWTFVDDSGKSAMKSSGCMITDLPKGRFDKAFHMTVNDRGFGTNMSAPHGGSIFTGNAFHITTEDIKFSTEIKSDLVDLDRAKHFIGVSGMINRKSDFFALSDPSYRLKACEALDMAVSRAAATGFVGQGKM